ncbi:hypothetical protein LMG27174_06887 [Paraburkholderia rhynchosiae]|uniref:IS6 family transposase n=1 Tax=Paraburkholderia rhynchosiae TaxID=487049 RepID=A0A6J5CPN5_9BURK|nr:hypothetical protein LMG27174_06887 [Paraburkholderia rhynchosiae]
MSKRQNLKELFAGRHFDGDVIILCVRWYLRYKLSLRDLVEMMAGARRGSGPNDDPPLGEALYAGVRQTVGLPISGG